MKHINVLIVDDSALIRQLFTELLSAEKDITVLDTASDPYDAREKIKRLNPDVLTLDIEMPRMDGLSFLEKIMTLRPMPVIMVSSLTQKGADATIKALEIGAFETVAKPADGQNRRALTLLKDELLTKIRGAARANLSARFHQGKSKATPGGLTYTPPARPWCELIAIGASTGGVEALREIFIRLPGNLPPIVVTQHMPAGFTASFAKRLNNLSAVQVQEARHHERIKPGHAYIAPGGAHLRIVKLGSELVCKLDEGPPISGHKPSVNALFHSVSEIQPDKTIAAILTGMGKDGAEGLLQLKEEGSYTIGQNEATCIVYGMPRVAASLDALSADLPIEEIAGRMVRVCEKREEYAA